TDSGNHEAGQEREPGPDDGCFSSLYAGLARLFWVLRNARSVDPTDSLGSIATSGCAVAALENPTPPPGDVASVGRARRTRGGNCRQQPWPLASGPFEGLVGCAFECVLSHSRLSVVERWQFHVQP